MKNSNRNFGILFSLIFLVIALWPFFYQESLRIWPFPISLIFLVLGLLNSRLLNPFKLVWIKLGELLGRIIAPIVMGIIFFTIITPIGIFMRLIGKDLLRTKFSKNKSYWIEKEKNIGSMKRQF